MKFFSVIVVFVIICSTCALGQVSNGRVNSLVAAENYFAATVKEDGIRDGFLKVSNSETVVFRPGAVKAETFYAKKQIDPGQLFWEPSLGRISRSGDWG